MVMIFFLAGCSKSLDEPVFVKQLVSSSDLDMDLMYISDTKWDKKVKSVQIPDAPKHIKTEVYEDVQEEKDGYSYHTVSLGMSTKRLNKDGSLKKPFSFEKVNITWDDGSKTTADIGTVTIQSTRENSGMKQIESGQTELEKGIVQYTSFETKGVLKLIDVQIPYEKEKKKSLPAISINAVGVDSIDKKHPLKLAKGELCTVESVVSQDSASEYGKIFLEGKIIGVNSKGQKKTTKFLITWNGFFDLDADAYIKN